MKISFKQGNMNKIHISVDGEYKFTVDAEYWYTSPYCRIKEITDDEECENFLLDVGSRYAFISGLRALSYSAKSRKELRMKLIMKGHSAACAENALDKLEELGYINDYQYAQDTAKKLIQTKHMSKQGIKNELYKRGINKETADEVLSQLEIDPIEEIRVLLNGNYSRYLNDEKGRKKTVASLQRLGYSWSDIKTALEKVTQDSEDMYYD